MLNNNNQDFKWLIKDFSILASEESLLPTLNYFVAFFDVSIFCQLCIF